jgi:hypothetical protein
VVGKAVPPECGALSSLGNAEDREKEISEWPRSLGSGRLSNAKVGAALVDYADSCSMPHLPVLRSVPVGQPQKLITGPVTDTSSS